MLIVRISWRYKAILKEFSKYRESTNIKIRLCDRVYIWSTLSKLSSNPRKRNGEENWKGRMAVNENLNYRNVRRGGEGRILPINRDHAIKPWLPSPRKRFSNKRCNHRFTIQTLVILTIIAFNIACAGVYR